MVHLLSGLAFALPAPPADMPPTGSDPIAEGTTTSDAQPLLVFVGATLPATLTVLETATGARQTPTLEDVGTARTPAWELQGLDLTEGGYLIEGPNWAQGFTVSGATAAAPEDPDRLAASGVFDEPDGEMGSGYGWVFEVEASPNSVFLYDEDGNLLTVRAPNMTDRMFWFSQASPEEGVCIALETRAADGTRSTRSDVVCSIEETGGCSSIPTSVGWWVSLSLLGFVRRRA